MKMQYGLIENIAKNVVFIDGITRSGKTMFSSILPSFERMEQIQFYTFLEHIIPAFSLGSIDQSLAGSLLRTNMNELAYNLLLSRNVNFRYDDKTGVHNYKDPELYVKRLKRADGPEVVQELRTTDRIIPFMTHDIMVNLEFIDQLDIPYKMIELYRHPVDNIYSWWTRGWGERFQSDPQSFTLNIGYEDKILPWYCAGYEKEWLDLNPMERCVRTGIDLIERSVKQHKKAARPENILTLTFEDFIQNTQTNIDKITSFIGTASTLDTSKSLIKERCPRKLDDTERKNKTQKFKENIRKDLFDKLTSISVEYEKDLYGLR